MVKRAHYFGIVVLLALMAIKVSAFHIYSHQDYEDSSIEDCSFCDFAIENQNAELLVGGFQEFEIKQPFFQKDFPLVAKEVVVATTERNLYLFLRPPPVS